MYMRDKPQFQQIVVSNWAALCEGFAPHRLQSENADREDPTLAAGASWIFGKKGKAMKAKKAKT